jgi:hypothetical protein
LTPTYLVNVGVLPEGFTPCASAADECRGTMRLAETTAE